MDGDSPRIDNIEDRKLSKWEQRKIQKSNIYANTKENVATLHSRKNRRDVYVTELTIYFLLIESFICLFV